MSACEKCWADAGGSHERYLELLAERASNPCTPEQQSGKPSASTDDGAHPSPPTSSVECPKCRTQLAFEDDVCGLCNPVAQP